ncbi:MAG: hypothetical protein ACOX2M_01580 [Fastidiosipilaceae bacterium]|jgi:hypothetical protein
MNSRDRIIAAINHRESDQVPFDLGATGQTEISVSASPSVCTKRPNTRSLKTWVAPDKGGAVRWILLRSNNQ